MRRLDLIDPIIGGNKIFKLKFFVEQAQKEGKSTLLTFGGAYSNHIAATAKFASQQVMRSIGLIRGEMHRPLNPTLQLASEHGMQLHYIDRETYRRKQDEKLLTQWRRQFNDPYMIPEGGAHQLGMKGAAEILTDQDHSFDAIVCAVGTGTTICGMAMQTTTNQSLIGIAIHRHSGIIEEAAALWPEQESIMLDRVTLVSDYHFGGYAKYDEQLLSYIRSFREDQGIQLDPIYTGKAMFALEQMIARGKFDRGQKFLLIHTGGLQGIAGFEQRHQVKVS